MMQKSLRSQAHRRGVFFPAGRTKSLMYASGLGVVALAFISLAGFGTAYAQPDQNDVQTPPGIWQNTYDLSRLDPRIRTKASGALMAVEVFHDRGSNQAKVTWVADRAICDDPLEAPCETIGKSGDSVARIIGMDLVFSAQLSPDHADPTFVVLRGPFSARTGFPATGYMMNAKAGYAYRFTWTPRFPLMRPSSTSAPKKQPSR
jgi:hypothetical protein